MRTNELWNRAYRKMIELYGDMPDSTLMNRFYDEKMMFGNSEGVVLLDLISKIKHSSEEEGYPISVSGTVGSCFVSYLLGAVDANPLPLHYYCPRCKHIEFVAEKALPWDIQNKECSCGTLMHADGFGIPFEMHTSMAHNPLLHIGVAPSFIEEAREIVLSAMCEYRIITLTKVDFEVVKYVFLPRDGFPNTTENIDAVGDKYRNYPQISLAPYMPCEYIMRLGKETKVDFLSVPLEDAEIITAFQRGNIDKIPSFISVDPDILDMKKVIECVKPRNGFDLLQILGAVHGTNTWLNNAEKLLKNGTCSIRDIPTHRDDIFALLKDCYGAGIAYHITKSVQMGKYANKGIGDVDFALISALDISEWFIPYIEKINYMFPKAHSVTYLKLAFISMWYKINYPQIYQRVMSDF